MIVRFFISGYYNNYNVCGCSEEAVTHLMAAHPVDGGIPNAILPVDLWCDSLECSGKAIAHSMPALVL